MFAFAILASSRVPRYEIRPTRPIFRIPRPFPRPVPIYKANGEEEDPENIWGTIIKEIAVEAAKSAAADAIYSAGKWGFHKVFGQESESNSAFGRIPRYPFPRYVNADEEQDPENIWPIVAAIAEEAAYTAAFEAGKYIGKKLFHEQAESNADGEIDPDNVWPIVIAIAKEVAISAATDAAIAAGKWGYHKMFGQEAESNYYNPFYPGYRLPIYSPFANADEEEDPENIWGTIIKEIAVEAAKSAAADAIYSAGKWGYHKIFGQEAESNGFPRPKDFARYYKLYSQIYRPRFTKNSEEEEDDSNPFWGPFIREVAKSAATKAATDAIVGAGKWGYHKVFGQEAESNSFKPHVIRPVWKDY